MPLRKMPNGEYVDVPDDITPEGLQRIERQFKRQARRAARQQPQAQPSREDREVSTRVQRMRDAGIGNGASDLLSQGYLFNFRDELAGGVNAVMEGIPRAIRERDIGAIPSAYRVGKRVDEQLTTDYRNENPGRALGAEVLGAVANPMGTGAGGVRAVGAGATKLGAARVGSAAQGLARQMGAGPVRSAVSAGVTQGALNAMGVADLEDMPNAMAEGAIIGGATGGLLGGLSHFARRGAQTITDALPSNATRTAHMRISELLDDANVSPAAARADIVATDKAGGDAMVMDLTPGLQAQAGHIARKPSVPSSNALIQRGEERIADRAARYPDNIRTRTRGLPTTDANARATSIEATRKAAGAADYGPGGAMDQPVTWTDELDNFVNGPRTPEPTRRAMANAYDELALRREDPNLIGKKMPDGSLIIHPTNFRVFDYMKRGFDTEIGKALKAGDNATAQGLSKELNTLKGLLGEQNPDYAQVLATQRDAFQKARAIEMGEMAMARLRKDPRSLLRDLNGLSKEDKLEARIGIVDALMAMDTKADPVGFFQSVSRNKAQRKVFEFAFGGKKQMDSFSEWVAKEARARRSDALTAPGRQSATSEIMLAADDAAGGSTNVLMNAMRGYAFGGTVGAFSGGVRTLQNISRGITRDVQEEIAKILLSKGDKLEEGVTAARQYSARRERTNKQYATLVAKGGQQGFTTALAGGED